MFLLFCYYYIGLKRICRKIYPDKLYVIDISWVDKKDFY